jgi:hypothetical protein
MAGGAHPRDAELFSPIHLPRLRNATTDLSWLLGRNYPLDASLALVGNRYDLVVRQRQAVARLAAAPDAIASRKSKQRFAPFADVDEVAIDAFNVIVGIENLLRGGVVLIGQDGCWRDMASVHGTYRTSEHTHAALELIVSWLRTNVCAPEVPVVWYIDSPVSNSGQLAEMIRALWHEPESSSWRAALVVDADSHVAATSGIAASADSVILDRAPAWLDLVAAIGGQFTPWLVDCSVEAGHC